MGATVQIPLKHNRLMNDKLFFMVVKRILESSENNYREDLHYKNPVDDSMILKICKDREEITITRHGENEVVIKIQGEQSLVREFIKEMAIEAATIICSDICDSVLNANEALKFNLHHRIKEGIELTFNEMDN